jgi:NADPH:quinone reductase-like Zn-dependent oxidoreductase
VTPVPAGVDVTRAAGLPTGALTAYQTIAPYVTEGQHGPRVFINGGGGGVGCFAVQIAKILGCHVTVSCSTAKADFCRGLGADDIVDYKAASVVQYLRAKGPVFDLCLDNVGNSPADLFSAGNDYLRPGSRYLFVGGKTSLASVSNILKSIVLPAALGGSKNKFTTVFTQDSKDDLAQLVQWLAEGKLQVPVDSTFAFADAKAGMQYVKAGSATGKVLVTL